MTSDPELQQQIDALAAQERQRCDRIRLIPDTTIRGCILPSLAVPTLDFPDISGLSLATGISFVDSILYSMGAR